MNKEAIRYEICKTVVNVEEKCVESYGIACICNNRILTMIDDISADKCFVEALANSFNELSLDPLHFRDVIEDKL